MAITGATGPPSRTYVILHVTSSAVVVALVQQWSQRCFQISEGVNLSLRDEHTAVEVFAPDRHILISPGSSSQSSFSSDIYSTLLIFTTSHQLEIRARPYLPRPDFDGPGIFFLSPTGTLPFFAWSSPKPRHCVSIKGLGLFLFHIPQVYCRPATGFNQFPRSVTTGRNFSSAHSTKICRVFSSIVHKNKNEKPSKVPDAFLARMRDRTRPSLI